MVILVFRAVVKTRIVLLEAYLQVHLYMAARYTIIRIIFIRKYILC